jgi:hypothetical protein
MPRKRADAELVALLTDLLTAAKAGELTALWAVYEGPQGYGAAWLTPDLDDMLVQVRTEIINTQTAINAVNALKAH